MLTSALILIGLVSITTSLVSASSSEGGGHNDDGGHNENGNSTYNETEYTEHVHPVTAVLFPWFSEIIGVLIFFLLTRYCSILPYTAVIFIIGTFMGIGALRLDKTDALSQSIVVWSKIDSELLLNVFLPGLIFHDAYSMNIHLFQLSIFQCLIMAFPMVLAGTCLVACVAFYIFPFDWSFYLSMTFGSILSATDPVAVSALLYEVGAPPRLKVHISGESLLNDGAAIVFFSIFSALYLYEIGQEEGTDAGDDYDFGRGVAIFFRMSCGGAAVGLGFGLGLLVLLYLLNRRLNNEENVFQIMATITVAYLTFYTAEVICLTSGVIAVLVCGLVTKQFGSNMINNRHMMESFWLLVENLLNTLLFALGGVVWGGIIANDDKRNTEFRGREWGYLILMYILLTVIRFFLFFSFYPLLSRIGLKTNVKETFFMSYGGLRGAVGIALAISLDNTVFQETESQLYRTQSNQLFGIVGGIALMTLVINGSTSGFLLRKLGLAEESDTRKKLVEGYNHQFRERILQDFIHKLCDERFQHVNFGLIEHHVPFLRGLTVEEFEGAVQRNLESTPSMIYQKPHTADVLYYLRKKAGEETATDVESEPPEEEAVDDQPTTKAAKLRRRRREKQMSFFRTAADDLKGTRHKGSAAMFQIDEPTEQDVATTKEMRNIFIELLRSAYQTQMDKGELDGRLAFVNYVLLQSLDFASDKVGQGEPLNDFQAIQLLWGTWRDSLKVTLKNLYFGTKQNVKRRASMMRLSTIKIEDENPQARSKRFKILRVRVPIVLAFLDAHLSAQKALQGEFSEPPFDVNGKIVALESKDQVRLATNFLESEDEEDVKIIISHLLCIILLNKFARYVESVTKLGFLKEKEAAHYIEEIEEQLEEIHHCTEDECEGHANVEPTGVVLDVVNERASSKSLEIPQASLSPNNNIRKRPSRKPASYGTGVSMRSALNLSDLPPEFLNPPPDDDDKPGPPPTTNIGLASPGLSALPEEEVEVHLPPVDSSLDKLRRSGNKHS